METKPGSAAKHNSWRHSAAQYNDQCTNKLRKGCPFLTTRVICHALTTFGFDEFCNNIHENYIIYYKLLGYKLLKYQNVGT
jgi:hypothetical protein